MLIDFYLAELTLKEHDPDREAILKRARVLYNRFLMLCDNYDLLSASDKNAFERGGSATLMSFGPAARRDEKIARYRAEKELEVKIMVKFPTFNKICFNPVPMSAIIRRLGLIFSQATLPTLP